MSCAGAKPKLLDLFCGAGGACKGYQGAGFHVVGVDIKPQPHYCGEEFHQADALTYPLEGFDAYHASPPCQHFTKYKNARKDLPAKYPNLIREVREKFHSVRYSIIENVAGAPLINAYILCGSTFGLDIQRHRYFETSFPLMTMPCNHKIWIPNRFPGGRSRERGNARIKCRGTVEIGRWNIPLKIQQKAMGINWMELEELSEAIPPAYTEFIGKYLMQAINEEGR